MLLKKYINTDIMDYVFLFIKNKGVKIFFFTALLLLEHLAIAQVMPSKLPQSVFIELITTTEKFEINHTTEFEHVDLPKKLHPVFLSYITDSAAADIPNVKNPVYYTFVLKNGKSIIGDIFFNDTVSYIVFKLDDKKYVNYFTREGVTKIKSIFKL